MTGWRRPAQWAGLVAVSVPLTWLLERAGFPAALLLGPMLAAIGFGMGGAAVRVPRLGFFAAQALIGCLIAHAITGAILVTLARDWLPMLLVLASTIAAGGLVGVVLVRLGTLPGATAAWGSSPGAASAMVAMAEEYGADPRLVAFMQYLRVLMVALGASAVAWLLHASNGPEPQEQPALFSLDLRPTALPATLLVAFAGAWLGRRLRVPAGGLLVPGLLGAVLHGYGLVTMELPPWLLGCGYAALGWYVGLRFDRETLLHALRAVPQLLLATLLLMGLCGVSAWLLTLFLGTDWLTAYLATSPGGLDTVTIIAVGSNADVSLVLAIQTLRLVLVIVTGPPIARLVSRLAR